MLSKTTRFRIAKPLRRQRPPAPGSAVISRSRRTTFARTAQETKKAPSDIFERFDASQAGRRLFSPTAGAQAASVSTATPAVPPEVREAAARVQEASDPYLKGVMIETYLATADDAWRAQFLGHLGSGELVSALRALDPTPDGGRASSGYEVQRSTLILSEAARTLPSGELARVLEGVGGESVANIVEYGLLYAESPYVAGSQGLDDRLAVFAGGLGAVADALGAAHPAVAETVSSLMTTPTHEFASRPSRAEMAAWLIARSEADGLKRWFVDTHISAAGVAGSPPAARALAMVMGSMEPPSTALRALVEAQPEVREALLHSALAPSSDSLVGAADAVLGLDWGIHRDIHQDVARFLGDIGRLNPQTFPGHEAEASMLRVRAFVETTEALDNSVWSLEQPMRDALAQMFAADAPGLLRQLKDSDHHGRVSSAFFQHVAFANEGASSRWVVEALNDYFFHTDPAGGVVDWLIASRGHQDLLPADGRNIGELSRELGFVFGCVHRGAQAALGDLQEDYDRQLEVVRRVGVMLGTLVEQIPKVGEFYQVVKSGTDDEAAVEGILTSLYEHFNLPELKNDQERVAMLLTKFLDEARAQLLQGVSTDSTLEAWDAMLDMVERAQHTVDADWQAASGGAR